MDTITENKNNTNDIVENTELITENTPQGGNTIDENVTGNTSQESDTVVNSADEKSEVVINNSSEKSNTVVNSACEDDKAVSINIPEDSNTVVNNACEDDKAVVSNTSKESNAVVNNAANKSAENKVSVDNINVLDGKNLVQDVVISNPNNEKKKKKWLIPLIIGIVILLLLGIFSTIFGLINMGNTKIIYGTKVSGIDISNLSKEDAYEKVNSFITEKLANPIILKHNDYETNIFAEQFEVTFDLNSAIDTAYNRGRSGNIFENNFNIISSFFSGTNISPSFSYNEESINTLLTEIETNLPDKLVEPNYYIEGNNLIITKGVDGVVVLRNNLKANIINYINNLYCMSSTIDIPCEAKVASAVDINKIHDEVYKAPQDAYFTTEPYALYPHVDGIDFSISVDEATQVLAQDTESYTIPLKVLSPNVTTNQIGTEAFPDLLAEYSTRYSTSNRNRSTNIALAASKINGIVIMPGEVFSYNQTVGKRTAEAGFKSAGAYSNGQVINTIGGGICQVSSTLYNAVLLSNLEIVERTNHYFDPGYVPAGRDATVSWGGPDFKFKNNRNYPIKVVCSGTGGTVNFKIYGLHVDGDYTVEIESKYIQTIKYKTIEQQDSSMAKGTTKVLESGSNGYKTETYKILKQNGTAISRNRISSDTYNPHNRVVAVGTK